MSKQVTITIVHCHQCPNLSFTNDMGTAYCCSDSAAILKQSTDDVLCLEDIKDIPTWCPLPNK